MKKQYFIVILVFCVLLTACGKKDEGNGTMNNGNVEGTDSAVVHFFELLKEDITGDGQSVKWNGKEASLVEDPLDSNTIDDGRYVIDGTTTVKVGSVFEYTYPNSLKNFEVVNDKEEDYQITAEGYDIRFETVDYQSAIDEMDGNVNFKKVEQEQLSTNQTKYFNQYQLYQGIIETDNGEFAGYVLIFDSALANRQMKITCGGIGLLEDIKQISFFLMNHFEILF